MATIVRDISRVMPLQSVPLLDMTLDDIEAFVISLKRANCPEYTDESSSDFGMQLIHTFSVLSKWIVDHGERIKNNSFLGTTVDREVMRRLCQMIGYTLSEASPASVSITFTCESGHPGFTIPAGTQVSTLETDDAEAVIFEVGANATVGAGVTSINVVCTQGQTITEEILGGSDGTTEQRFNLAKKSVIWHSESIEVRDSAWIAWTMVDDFTESSPTDKHYRVETLADGTYQIIFGDGINGAIPARLYSNIRATYRIGGGSEGNVSAGSITELLSSVQYLESAANVSAASGGTESETIEHARIYAPSAIRTLKRAVTIEDIESLCEAYYSTSYGGIAQAKAYTRGTFVARVAIVPRSGGVPSAGLRSELSSMLQDKAMIGTLIEVVDPSYVAVDIDADISVLESYSLDVVSRLVKSRLSNYLSPTFQDPSSGLYPHDFGRNIHLSDIYTVIRQTPGVDYCKVNIPTADTIVAQYRIATPGTITITPYGDVDAPPFHDARKGTVVENITSEAAKQGFNKYGTKNLR